MNVTISIDDTLLARARAFAQRRGTSVQELVRGYLEELVGDRSPEVVADELAELFERESGRSGGASIRRGDAYTDRT